MSWDTLVYLVVAVLLITLILDIWRPRFLREGFLVSPGDNPFVTAYFPRRGDISFDEDESGFIQDPRNVRGFSDVQSLGVKHDFCRMVIPKGKDDEKDRFFACALAGTENLSSTNFRTQSVRNGFKTSRDDYMRDNDKDGKYEYCAVVKSLSGQWEPQCYRALTTSFDTRTLVDIDPPADIADIYRDINKIDHQTLLIVGDMDRLTPKSASMWLESHMKKGQLKVIEGASHIPFLSHPDEFFRHLDQFLLAA